MVESLFRVLELAGRKYGTSLRLYLIAAPFLIFGIAFTELELPWSVDSFLSALLIGLAGHLALGLILFLSSLFIRTFLGRTQLRWFEFLGITALAALARGLAIGFVSASIGIGELNLVERVATSLALIIFSWTVGAYSLELFSQFTLRRQELLRSLIEGERANLASTLATDSLVSVNSSALAEDIERVRRQTFEALDSLRAKLSSGYSQVSGLKELFQNLDGSWREVSHRAWRRAEEQAPGISFSEFLRTLASNYRISILVVLAGPVYGLFRIFGALPNLERFQASLIWFFGAVSLAALTNLVRPKSESLSLVLFGAGFIAQPILAVGIGTVFLPSSALQLGFVASVAVLVASTSSIGRALEASAQNVLEDLERRLSESTLQRLRGQSEMFVLAQRIGKYLHSDLRSEFLRLSTVLRSDLESGRPENSLRVIEQMQALVSQVTLESSSGNEDQDFKEFLENWGKLVRIESNLEQQVLPAHVKLTAFEVVREALADAVRHGDASWIKINAQQLGPGLQLSIESDGKLTEVEKSGLGSKLLDRVAPNNWSRNFGEVGAVRLVVTLRGSQGEESAEYPLI